MSIYRQIAVHARSLAALACAQLPLALPATRNRRCAALRHCVLNLLDAVERRKSPGVRCSRRQFGGALPLRAQNALRGSGDDSSCGTTHGRSWPRLSRRSPRLSRRTSNSRSRRVGALRCGGRRNSLLWLAWFGWQRRSGDWRARSLFTFSSHLVVRVQNVTPTQGPLGLFQPLLVSQRELLLGFHDDPLNDRRVRSGMKPAKNNCRSHDDLASPSIGRPRPNRASVLQSKARRVYWRCQLFGVIRSRGPSSTGWTPEVAIGGNV